MLFLFIYFNCFHYYYYYYYYYHQISDFYLELFYFVMCSSMVTVNRLRIPTVAEERMSVFFPPLQKVGGMSVFYDFLI